MELWRKQRFRLAIGGTNQAALAAMEDNKPTARELAEDLLLGADDIAAFLGVSRKSVYYLSSKKRLPIGRLGKQLIARKSQLRRAIDSLT